MGQKQYKCLIVDDDPEAHYTLEAHAGKYSDVTITGKTYSGKEAIDLLQSHEFEILFLDIEMPNLSGLELLQVLPVRPATIITSAHTKYAFDAYQKNVVDYIQKPVMADRFAQALEKACVYVSVPLNRSLQKTIELKSDRKLITVNISDVIYIKSLGNYMKVYLKQVIHPVVCYGSLRDLNDQLASHDFIQVHKSYLVNKQMISQKIELVLSLKDGSQIPVGNKYDFLVDRMLQPRLKGLNDR